MNVSIIEINRLWINSKGGEPKTATIVLTEKEIL
jgi:hypothetical protein